MGYEALNDKTFQPVEDPRLQAISRCLYRLIGCANTMLAAEQGAANLSAREAAARAIHVWLNEMETLGGSKGCRADLEVLAKLLGCRLYEMPANGKAVH